MDIDTLVEQATAQAAASGFTDLRRPRLVDTHVALLTTEVGELYEAHRDGMAPGSNYYQHPGHNPPSGSQYDEEGNLGKPVGIPSELADIVIRCANMAGEYGIDLNGAILEKMTYNATRPRMHGRHA